MKIQLLHDTINFFLGKGQTGYYEPERLDVLIHGESYALFREYVAQVARNKAVTDFLRPFERFTNRPVVSGKVEKPEDYEHHVGLMIDDVGCEVLEKFQWVKLLNHPVRIPDKTHPVVTVEESTILVLPLSAERLTGWYYRSPSQPKYGYQVSGNRYVFNATKSKDIEWGEQMVPKLALRVLAGLGVNLRSEDIFSYSQALKQEQI